MTYNFERERNIEESLEAQGNPSRREDKKESHVDEIAIAVQVAVKTLLSVGNMRRVEQQSEHATIVAYFVNDMIHMDVRPRA